MCCVTFRKIVTFKKIVDQLSITVILLFVEFADGDTFFNLAIAYCVDQATALCQVSGIFFLLIKLCFGWLIVDATQPRPRDGGIVHCTIELSNVLVNSGRTVAISTPPKEWAPHHRTRGHHG